MELSLQKIDTTAAFDQAASNEVELMLRNGR